MASEHNLYVKINIGGEKLIAVCPDLFGVAGDNKLAAVFSNRWDRLLDADGSYFVDYCPDVFLPLVEWLREVRDSEPDTWSVPVRLKDECRRPWVRMMKALSFDMKALRKAGIGLHEMRMAGISEESIKTAGFDASDVQRGHSKEDCDRAGLEENDFWHFFEEWGRHAGKKGKVGKGKDGRGRPTPQAVEATLMAGPSLEVNLKRVQFEWYLGQLKEGKGYGK
eukprot:Skav223354  [mRNA]  locus=scaffold200:476386:477054:+ [translate_table: standard]